MAEELIYRAYRLAQDDDAYTPLIEDSQQRLLHIIAPLNLVPGPNHPGQQLEAAFDQTCIALELSHIPHPGELSCYDFYCRVEFLERRQPTG